MSEPTIYKVRASSWGSLFDCAYRWEGVHLLGISSPSSPRAMLGTAFHAGTAAFDTARMNGSPITPDDAAEALVRTIRQPERDVDWTADRKLGPRDVEKIALGLHSLYCTEWSPRFEFAAVEMETKPLDIDCGTGIVVRLTGTMDRMRLHATPCGKKRVGDLKSGSRAIAADGTANVKGHKPQVGTYQLLTEHTVGEEVDDTAEIIGASTKPGAPVIAAAEIHGAKDVLLGDGETPGYIERAARMFRTGQFDPNPQSVLCHPRYCPRYYQCKFHD